VPYQIGRFVRGHQVRAETRSRTQSDPRELLKRFYFDALIHGPRALRFLIDTVGADRVVLGTDSPYDMGEQDPLKRLDEVPSLTPSEREAICSGNAEQLFDGKL
jgi:aminocarboxymuconate-semialdehyde decarboxylase